MIDRDGQERKMILREPCSIEDNEDDIVLIVYKVTEDLNCKYTTM